MSLNADRTLIIIPARGGSKRLPRKNVLPLLGKPLIRHSTDVAIEAGIFKNILVSTDDKEISKAASKADGITIDSRDAGLANDTTKVIDVITEICARPETQSRFDVIGMLLPTCPLRSADDLVAGHAMLEPGIDAVVSFTEYEFSPLCAVNIAENGDMKPVYEHSPLITGNTRTQDQVTAYRPNGAFFFSWIESLLRLKSFYTGNVRGHVMPRARSVDIDNEEDFALAEWTLNRRSLTQ